IIVKLQDYSCGRKKTNHALFLLNVTDGLPDAPGFAKACGIEAHEVRNFFNHLNAGATVHAR
ncbi:MAG TPA: hypothetical protein VK369_04060, partial [Segetibacter sp.]|nr:hypothetical protein [Segetibacter sp.]